MPPPSAHTSRQLRRTRAKNPSRGPGDHCCQRHVFALYGRALARFDELPLEQQRKDVRRERNREHSRNDCAYGADCEYDYTHYDYNADYR